jgi:hypothetical protein
MASLRGRVRWSELGVISDIWPRRLRRFTAAGGAPAGGRAGL